MFRIGSFSYKTIGECRSTLYVGLAHAVPSTNTKFKQLLLPTQAGMQYTYAVHKHSEAQNTIFQVYTHISGAS